MLCKNSYIQTVLQGKINQPKNSRSHLVLLLLKAVRVVPGFIQLGNLSKAVTYVWIELVYLFMLSKLI